MKMFSEFFTQNCLNNKKIHLAIISIRIRIFNYYHLVITCGVEMGIGTPPLMVPRRRLALLDGLRLMVAV